MDRLTGKTALITGGTTGIGFAAARLFAAEGARVIATGNSPENLGAARHELGPDVEVVRADSASVPAMRELAALVAERFGRLDAAFLNAGIADWRTIEEWDEEGFDRSFGTNIRGPFFLIQALLPILGNPASIVLNGSLNAHMGSPRSSVYGASKAGVISLAKTLSGELAPRGIRVNVVTPGPVDTPLLGKLGVTSDHMPELIGRVPAGRFGRPDDIARAALYLCSDESSFTVGSELIVDGGRIL